MIRLVDRLVWREMLGHFVNAVLLFMLLLFGAAYLFKITDLLVSGVPLGLVLRVTLYSLPGLVTQTLPMSMLLAALLAFGRLSSDSEHIALFAGGISFFRIARPVALMGLVVSIATFLWNETVVPPSTRAYYELVQNATETIQATDKPLNYIVKTSDGRVDEFVNIAGGYDARTKQIRGVTIVKMSDDPARRGEPELALFAERAAARDPRGLDWEFYDVYLKSLRPDANGNSIVDVYMKQAATKTLPANLRVGKTFRGVMQADVTDNRRMTFRELRDKINTERKEGNPNTLGDEVDLWEKLSLPLASVVFGLVGAPLGIRPQRSGKAMGFGIAIAIIFLYWVVYRWMYVVGKSGGVPPLFASFTACLLGLIAATVLIARVRQ
ncbi:MAG: LptF/LptG family permease [Chthonomonadales bacterium]|nr:LptF/LptG family permease [Chthonomonadales bacterium]